MKKSIGVTALAIVLFVTVLPTTVLASTESDNAKWYKEYRERKKYEQSLKNELGGSSWNKYCRWLNKDNNWYYFGDIGELETGWFSTIYYIDDSENIIPDHNTYYADELGRMQTGWIQDSLDNKWYYLTESGALLKNGTTPDGYKVDEFGAMIENSDNQVERNKTLEIFHVAYSENSVGGISPIICWRNGTGKTIKYITFDMVPYNAVGDKQACEIAGYSNFSGRITGPIESEGEVGDYISNNSLSYSEVNKDYLGRPYKNVQNYERVLYNQDEINRTFSQRDSWDCAWYNNTINEIRLTGIKIEYMDGSTQAINPSDAYYWK